MYIKLQQLKGLGRDQSMKRTPDKTVDYELNDKSIETKASDIVILG